MKISPKIVNIRAAYLPPPPMQHFPFGAENPFGAEFDPFGAEFTPFGADPPSLSTPLVQTPLFIYPFGAEFAWGRVDITLRNLVLPNPEL